MPKHLFLKRDEFPNEVKAFNDIRELVMSHEICSPKELCDRMHRPYSTTMRELNEYDDGAKLGFLTALRMMAETEDFSPIENWLNNSKYRKQMDALSEKKSKQK